MGEAKRRGTYEQRKANAIAAGRVKSKRPRAMPQGKLKSPLDGLMDAITWALAARRTRIRR